MSDDEIVFEFSEMEDELYAYRVVRDTMGGKHYDMIAKGDEAYRMKYGKGKGE